MNQEDIIRMAKKAELHCHMNLAEHGLALEDLEHFAALVSTAEYRRGYTDATNFNTQKYLAHLPLKENT